ncbi:MAG: ribonuclease P protein component [Ignavibacteriaceae bacterium]|nr:ribonuclease P protein component [Ignavibacteriaceae bacterium]
MKNLGLSAFEKIKSRKDFEEIFSEGITLFSSTKKIKAVYIIKFNSNQRGFKVAFAISRKSGNAVWRNRIKRLLREAFRLNKHIIIKKTEELRYYIEIIFSPYLIDMNKNKNIYLDDIMPDVIDIMSRISINV